MPSEPPSAAPVETAEDAASVLSGPTPVAPVDKPAPMPPEIAGLGTSREQVADFGRETLSTLAESRLALATGFEALSEEVAGLARCGIDTAARTAIEMLAVRTVSDAVAVNAGFVRASFDNWIGRSARFSELAARLAADSSRLFLERLGNSWIGVSRTSS